MAAAAGGGARPPAGPTRAGSKRRGRGGRGGGGEPGGASELPRGRQERGSAECREGTETRRDDERSETRRAGNEPRGRSCGARDARTWVQPREPRGRAGTPGERRGRRARRGEGCGPGSGRHRKAGPHGRGRSKRASGRTEGRRERARKRRARRAGTWGAQGGKAPPLPGGWEDPRGRDPSGGSFLRVTPAEVRGRGAEGGVWKAAGPPGWEDGARREDLGNPDGDPEPPTLP